MILRQNLQQGYVLHRRAYRETSQLLEVFTREHGRIGLVGRGVRRSKGRPGPALEPLQELLISWTMRGDLGRLNHAESSGQMLSLTGEALFSALYLNELLLRLTTRHDPHPDLYDHYRDALSGLRDARPDVPLRHFEKHLLQELGYGLNLTHSIDGAPICADLHYDCQAGIGARVVKADSRSGLVVKGSSLLALESGQLNDPESLRDAKLVLRAALAGQLGDRPLNTPKLFRSLRRIETGTSSEASNTQETS